MCQRETESWHRDINPNWGWESCCPRSSRAAQSSMKVIKDWETTNIRPWLTRTTCPVRLRKNDWPLDGAASKNRSLMKGVKQWVKQKKRTAWKWVIMKKERALYYRMMKLETRGQRQTSEYFRQNLVVVCSVSKDSSWKTCGQSRRAPCASAEERKQRVWIISRRNQKSENKQQLSDDCKTKTLQRVL